MKSAENLTSYYGFLNRRNSFLHFICRCL